MGSPERMAARQPLHPSGHPRRVAGAQPRDAVLQRRARVPGAVQDGEQRREGIQAARRCRREETPCEEIMKRDSSTTPNSAEELPVGTEVRLRKDIARRYPGKTAKVIAHLTDIEGGIRLS